MHRGRPMGESFDHGPPGWIRQGRKRCTQFIHNRMVVDYRAMSSVNFAIPDFEELGDRRDVSLGLSRAGRCQPCISRGAVGLCRGLDRSGEFCGTAEAVPFHGDPNTHDAHPGSNKTIVRERLPRITAPDIGPRRRRYRLRIPDPRACCRRQ